MKSMKLISASALALLALSTSATAFAAEATTTPGQYQTKGKVTLTTDPNEEHPGGGDDGNDGDNPSDPTNPDVPGDGNDNTHQTGPFTLDVVPNYDFGVHTAENIDKTYYALFTSDKGVLDEKRLANPYVQVTDLRENNTGWHVTANITDFTTKAGKKLDGAKLTMPAGTTHLYGDPEDQTDHLKPTTNKVTLNSGDQTFMQADANAGVGTWMDYMFENNNTALTAATDTNATSLFVPGNNSAGQYSADLTWTLNDTPQA